MTKKLELLESLAEINNLLMKIEVRGDNVFLLARAMDMCISKFEELEKDEQLNRE